MQKSGVEASARTIAHLGYALNEFVRGLNAGIVIELLGIVEKW
jgi:hypothetical protein